MHFVDDHTLWLNLTGRFMHLGMTASFAIALQAKRQEMSKLSEFYSRFESHTQEWSKSFEHLYSLIYIAKKLEMTPSCPQYCYHSELSYYQLQ
jgi:hypothetical protein